MRDPFVVEESLVNLATGEIADDSVNAHQAFEIGEKLIHEMNDQPVFSFSYKRKEMVVPMKTKSSLSIEGEKVVVDSTLLFQSLIAVYSLEELSFGYKSSTRPMSLFGQDGLMNEPKLKHALSKLLTEIEHVIPSNR